MNGPIPFTASASPLIAKEVGDAGLPMSLALMAQECANKLNAYGKTIKDATDFFIAHIAAGDKSCTTTKLVDELVAARQEAGASQFDVEDMRCRLAMFAKKFEGQPVGTITGAEIADWLRSLKVSAITRNHYRRLIVLAFNFAVQRGYVTDNPLLARFVVSGDCPSI
jgi:hypothetical protein